MSNNNNYQVVRLGRRNNNEFDETVTYCAMTTAYIGLDLDQGSTRVLICTNVPKLYVYHGILGEVSYLLLYLLSRR